MIKIKHFVITLFNLNLYSCDKSMNPVCTDVWLKNRFKLFESFCLPSMKHQTAQDYIWLCFFDVGTPKEYKAKIEGYQKEVPQFVPCFLDEQETKNWREYIVKTMVGFLDDKDDYVITTNLDNDDLFHKEALAVIQDRVQSELKTGLYVFTTGLQYFVNQNMLVKMSYPHNHFMSLCEEYNEGKLKTVKFAEHGHIKRMVDHVIEIKDKPYWIETVHGENVGNDVRITSRVHYFLIFKQICLNDYGVDIAFYRFRNLGMTLIFFPYLLITASVRKILKKMSKNFGAVL